MANQITINIGAAANDGTGDPLRTAFNDVNLNFANVWNTGLPNSNIQFSDNRILTVNTNANLVLAPNGIGKVASNVDIVPNTSNVLMLGSTTRRWNQIYTQYIDASANFNLSGDLTVGGNLTVTGNIIEMGNIVTDALTLQLANTASNTTAANGAGITVGANDNIATLLYNSTSNIWTTNIGISAVGNISAPYFVGNGSQLTGITSYANANAVAYGQAGWAGNIIPSGNAVYSLGNATNQWKSLYVSNTTIYINNVPIGLSAGNVLTVNGDDVVTTNANGQTSLGNLSVDDNNIYNTNGQGVVISNFSFIAEAETAYVQIPAGNSAGDLSVVQTQGNVRLVANAAAWTFDTTGNITLPGNTSSINYANGAPYGGGGGGGLPVANGTSNINIATANGNVTVTTAGTYTWNFNTNGTLTVPGDITCNETLAISSGDDINISGGNKVPGSASSEGGDITIFGGAGRPDSGTSVGSGGDVRINAGDGGDGTLSGAGTGGYAEVQGGSGGAANVVNNIQAGEGGYVVIQGGQGGDNAGNNALSGIGGNVEIYGGTGSADGGNSTISGTPGHVNLYGGNWGFAGIATGNIYLNTYDGTNFKTLTYDNVGNVTMAPGGGINFVGTNPGIVQSLNKDLKLTVSDNEDDGWAVTSIVNDGAGNDFTRMQVRYDGVQINTDIPTNNYNWTFRDSGEFDVPKSIRGPVGGNLVVSIGDQVGSDTFIDLQTRSYVGDALISNVRIANPNVTVSTSSGAYNWTFGGTGNLTLPLSGNIVGATANNNGYLNWFGNSSGDGGGYTTLRLVPDDTRESSDQYLIIDPTAPGHIHIRAGGTQDNSSADLFLGGENSYFKVSAGANNEVRISANSYPWVFGADSILTVPGEGIIRSIQDTVILQSYDIYGNTYSARLGTNGGLYFETTDYPLGWLNLTNSSGDANISSPGGKINIDSANGTSGAAGKDINITAGDADQTDYYTTAGGDVNIQGGMGAFNDGGGGGPGGDVNLVAGTSADPAGHAGNVTITSGSWNWQFINNGNLYVPGQINGDNNGALIIDGAGYGNGYISLPAGSFGGEQVAIVNDFSLGNGIALTTNGGTWHFSNSGNLTLPGNTFAVNYANGTAVSLGGGSSYGDSNVTTLLAGFGSNTISTTGNITGGNIITAGTATVTGNVTTTGYFISGNQATGGFRLGNVNSRITAGGSNSYATFGQNIAFYPDTGLSAFAGVLIGGNGYLLAPNGSRVLTLSSDGSVAVNGNITQSLSATQVISTSGLITATGNITGGNLITGGSVYTNTNGGGLLSNTLTTSTYNIYTQNQSSGQSKTVNIATGALLSTSTTVVNIGTQWGNSNTTIYGNLISANNASFSNTATITTSNYAIGYRDIPQITFSANANAALTDAGKHYYSTTAGNLELTLPDNSTTAFPTGTAMTIVVQAAGNVLVNAGTGVTLYMGGSSTAGNRVVGAYGMATVMKVAANVWFINGTGVY